MANAGMADIGIVVVDIYIWDFCAQAVPGGPLPYSCSLVTTKS